MQMSAYSFKHSALFFTLKKSYIFNSNEMFVWHILESAQ